VCRKCERDLIPVQLKILLVGCSSRFRYFPRDIIVSTFRAGWNRGTFLKQHLPGTLGWGKREGPVCFMIRTRRMSPSTPFVCSTDVLPCESLLPSPQSQYRPHRKFLQASCPSGEPYNIHSWWLILHFVKVRYGKQLETQGISKILFSLFFFYFFLMSLIRQGCTELIKSDSKDFYKQ